MTDQEAYKLYPRDKWVYDKPYLSTITNGRCSVGDCEQPIPSNDTYCIKPVVNLEGCSIGSSFVSNMKGWIPPKGMAWFKFYTGVHWTADYRRQPDGSWKPDSLFIGLPTPVHGKFAEWARVDAAPVTQGWIEHDLGGRPDYFQIPTFLKDVRSAPIVNVEYIGNNIIEAHLRGNTDPVQWDTFVPVWDDYDYYKLSDDEWKQIGYQYIKDVQNHPHRVGFWVRDIR